MDERKIEELDRFQAVDDDGNKYTVVVTVTLFRTPEIASVVPWERGTEEYQLSNGHLLDPIPNGRFKIVQTGKVIRKLT